MIYIPNHGLKLFLYYRDRVTTGYNWVWLQKENKNRRKFSSLIKLKIKVKLRYILSYSNHIQQQNNSTKVYLTALIYFSFAAISFQV